MRMLEEFFPEFTEKLDEIDKLYAEKRMIDEKTYQFICFALSIKARSKPCVLKHFKGALEAGATVKELSYIFALVMREAAGADDCWTHDVIGDWKEILKGNISSAAKNKEHGIFQKIVFGLPQNKLSFFQTPVKN